MDKMKNRKKRTDLEEGEIVSDNDDDMEDDEKETTTNSKDSNDVQLVLKKEEEEGLEKCKDENTRRESEENILYISDENDIVCKVEEQPNIEIISCDIDIDDSAIKGSISQIVFNDDILKAIDDLDFDEILEEEKVYESIQMPREIVKESALFTRRRPEIIQLEVIESEEETNTTKEESLHYATESPIASHKSPSYSKEIRGNSCKRETPGKHQTRAASRTRRSVTKRRSKSSSRSRSRSRSRRGRSVSRRRRSGSRRRRSVSRRRRSGSRRRRSVLRRRRSVSRRRRSVSRRRRSGSRRSRSVSRRRRSGSRRSLSHRSPSRLRSRAASRLRRSISRRRHSDSRTSPIKAVNRKSISRSRSRSRFRKSRSVSATTSHNTASATAADCDFCHEKHYIAMCPRFKDLDVNARKSKVILERLCFNCLGKHSSRNCCTTNCCKECGVRHHTLLHGSNFMENLPPRTDRVALKETERSVFNRRSRSRSNSTSSSQNERSRRSHFGLNRSSPVRANNRKSSSRSRSRTTSRTSSSASRIRSPLRHRSYRRTQSPNTEQPRYHLLPAKNRLNSQSDSNESQGGSSAIQLNTRTSQSYFKVASLSYSEFSSTDGSFSISPSNSPNTYEYQTPPVGENPYNNINGIHLQQHHQPNGYFFTQHYQFEHSPPLTYAGPNRYLGGESDVKRRLGAQRPYNLASDDLRFHLQMRSARYS